MFPLTRVPFWYQFFEPKPFTLYSGYPSETPLYKANRKIQLVTYYKGNCDPPWSKNSYLTLFDSVVGLKKEKTLLCPASLLLQVAAILVSQPLLQVSG